MFLTEGQDSEAFESPDKAAPFQILATLKREVF
jgi:hypothetical protein